MATQLQLVNRVLRRLREDEVATVVENDYSILIAEFINSGIEEVLDAHDWQRYAQLMYAELLLSGSQANTANLSLTTGASGQVHSTITLKEASKLTWCGHDVPQILYSNTDYPTALTTDVTWTRLAPVSYSDYMMLVTKDNTSNQSTVELPSICSFYDLISESDGSLNRYLSIWPYSDAAGTLAIAHWTPPDELALDGTDDSTAISTPNRPVFEFALMTALNERGEEIGEPGNMAERRYIDSLGRAIETDLDFSQRTDKFDWRRD